MAMPTFQAAGTYAEAGNGADLVLSWPAHLAGDIALAVIEAANGSTPDDSPPAGWAVVPNGAQDTGVDATHFVFWRRATGASEGSVTFAGATLNNHGSRVIVTFRDCVASGDPWDVKAGGLEETASTAINWSSVTTTVANTLIERPRKRQRRGAILRRHQRQPRQHHGTGRPGNGAHQWRRHRRRNRRMGADRRHRHYHRHARDVHPEIPCRDRSQGRGERRSFFPAPQQPAADGVSMTIYLKQSTASQEVPLGTFVDSTDGNSEETGLTIANTDVKIWKTGATTLASKNSGGATHVAHGIYYVVLDATDTNTFGPMVIFVHVAGALCVRLECCVLAANIYDSLIGGGDILDVSVTQWLGTAAATRIGSLPGTFSRPLANA
jgi:hypothetical protein